MEADGTLNVFEEPKGLFPPLTSREPPSEEALDWLQLAYTEDWAGVYVAPSITFLGKSAVAE